MYEKFKDFLADDAIFYGLLIVLVATTSFGLGRLSMTTEAPTVGTGPSVSMMVATTSSYFIGSLNGSVYHFPWCPGAAQIKEENQVIFDSKEKAEASGYAPAGNCPGL